MNTKDLTPTLAVSAQLKLSDLDEAKDQGFKAIINNRPDGETICQPKSEELNAHADALGLDYYYIPVFPGKMTEQNIVDFKAVLNSVEGKALAFCRSGTRSTYLWAFSQSGTLTADEIVKKAADAGYDLRSLRPALA